MTMDESIISLAGNVELVVASYLISTGPELRWKTSFSYTMTKELILSALQGSTQIIINILIF